MKLQLYSNDFHRVFDIHMIQSFVRHEKPVKGVDLFGSLNLKTESPMAHGSRKWLAQEVQAFRDTILRVKFYCMLHCHVLVEVMGVCQCHD